MLFFVFLLVQLVHKERAFSGGIQEYRDLHAARQIWGFPGKFYLFTLCRADDAPVSHPKNLHKWVDDAPMRHPF